MNFSDVFSMFPRVRAIFIFCPVPSWFTEYTSKISTSNISSAGMGAREHNVTLCFRGLKEGLEKRPENQDNVVCEKSAEDHRGHHGSSD